MRLVLLIPLRKVFSDAARLAALEARRRLGLRAAQVVATVRREGDAEGAYRALDTMGFRFKGSVAHLRQFEELSGVRIEEVAASMASALEQHGQHGSNHVKLLKLDRLEGPSGPLGYSVGIVSRVDRETGTPEYITSSREFNFKPGQRSVNMALLTLPKGMQGRGVGKEIMRNQLALFDRMGMTKMTTRGGNYGWLRHGYLPDQPQVPGILTKATSNVNRLVADEMISPEVGANIKTLLRSVKAPKDLWSIADHKFGKEVLEGIVFTAGLDLSPTSPSRARLTSYIGG